MAEEKSEGGCASRFGRQETMLTEHGSGVIAGVAYSYSFTVHNDHQATFEWNLVRIHECRSVRYLISRPLKVGTSHWSVQLYPQGNRLEDCGFLSIFCGPLDGPTQNVHFTFGALGAHSDKLSFDCFVEAETEHSWGYRRFLHHRFLDDQGHSFYRDETLRLVVTIEIQDPLRTTFDDIWSQDLATAESRERRTPPARGPECVVCMNQPQTSGFLHEGESVLDMREHTCGRVMRRCHKCVCEQCARKLASTMQNLTCPVCMAPVDRIIYKFF